MKIEVYIFAFHVIQFRIVCNLVTIPFVCESLTESADIFFILLSLSLLFCFSLSLFLSLSPSLPLSLSFGISIGLLFLFLFYGWIFIMDWWNDYQYVMRQVLDWSSIISYTNRTFLCIVALDDGTLFGKKIVCGTGCSCAGWTMHTVYLLPW